MKRSLFRVGAALATLALAGTLAACSAGSSSSTSKTGTSTSTSTFGHHDIYISSELQQSQTLQTKQCY